MGLIGDGILGILEFDGRWDSVAFRWYFAGSGHSDCSLRVAYLGVFESRIAD